MAAPAVAARGFADRRPVYVGIGLLRNQCNGTDLRGTGDFTSHWICCLRNRRDTSHTYIGRR
jgi:hypothetical protein